MGQSGLYFFLRSFMLPAMDVLGRPWRLFPSTAGACRSGRNKASRSIRTGVPCGSSIRLSMAGRGWFSSTSADCTLKKAGDTRSNRAAVLIGMACRRLYDEPPIDWESGVIRPPR